MTTERIWIFLQGVTGVTLIEGLDFYDVVEIERIVLQSIIGVLTIIGLLRKIKPKRK